jgi:phospholipase/carboxylesterase
MRDIHAISQPPREPSSERPLVLFLHGYGSNEHDLMSLGSSLDPRLTLVSARAVYEIDMGFGYAWYELYGVPGHLTHNNENRAESLEILVNFIRGLPEKFSVNPQKIYLFGFSQGAVMCLDVMLSHPELVAGVVACSGYLGEEVRPRAPLDHLQDLDVLMMHGTFDDVIPVRRGREARDYLQDTPVNLSYHEYPIGHGIHPAALPVIETWFQEQITAPVDSQAGGQAADASES